mmetsp:Transcript_39386/g.125690  ORF Transcript_39386/g.125690 Transcript_39386/m.125690 type:complete len:203 (+) Transcript_39386:1952-2560(+)
MPYSKSMMCITRPSGSHIRFPLRTSLCEYTVGAPIPASLASSSSTSAPRAPMSTASYAACFAASSGKESPLAILSHLRNTGKSWGEASSCTAAPWKRRRRGAMRSTIAGTASSSSLRALPFRNASMRPLVKSARTLAPKPPSFSCTSTLISRSLSMSTSVLSPNSRIVTGSAPPSNGSILTRMFVMPPDILDTLRDSGARPL